MKLAKQEEIVGAVENVIHTLKGKVTAPDVAAATGLSVADAKYALQRQMELWASHVSLDEQTGHIAWHFEYPLRKRGELTTAEKLAKVRATLWRAFTVVYKASLGLILIAYTVVFAVILIGLAMSTKGDRDSDDGPDVGNIIGGILRALAEAFYWRAVLTPYGYEYDADDVRYVRTREKKKNFIQAVYDFAFGPPRAVPTDEENAKEAAAFIRQRGGLLRPAHVLALSGGTFDVAEDRFADYVVRYAGDIELRDDGVVEARFADMTLNTASKAADSGVVYYWNEVEPPWELNGNGGGQNLAIIAMNGFNVVMSLVFTFGDTEFGGLIWLLLGPFPLVVSLLLFAMPAFRLASLPKKKERRTVELGKKMLSKYIFANPGAKFYHADLLQMAAKAADGDSSMAEKIVRTTVSDFRGDTLLDDAGRPCYAFPRIAKEM